jgi:hypothetical protein
MTTMVDVLDDLLAEQEQRRAQLLRHHPAIGKSCTRRTPGWPGAGPERATLPRPLAGGRPNGPGAHSTRNPSPPRSAPVAGSRLAPAQRPPSISTPDNPRSLSCA